MKPQDYSEDPRVAEAASAMYSRMEAARRERAHLLQAEGIARAKARGVRFGRRSVDVPENFAELVGRWERKELTLARVLEKTGLSEPTFYRRLRELRADRAKGGNGGSVSL